MRSMHTRTQYVQVGILHDTSVTLQYEGTCMWAIEVSVEGISQEKVIKEGPEVMIGHNVTQSAKFFSCLCRANGNLLLNVTFAVYDADEIPAPTEITLRIDTLQWDHVLHLPALPAGFRVFTNYNISYFVTVRDMESGENGETWSANETSLNVSQVLDDCRRQTFTVQTLVNDMVSGQSSSYNTTPKGVCIASREINGTNDSTPGDIQVPEEFSPAPDPPSNTTMLLPSSPATTSPAQTITVDSSIYLYTTGAVIERRCFNPLSAFAYYRARTNYRGEER
ncbi:hypothetical protein GBAR_LOCUS15751, partial [Geodia barretti]